MGTSWNVTIFDGGQACDIYAGAKDVRDYLAARGMTDEAGVRRVLRAGKRIHVDRAMYASPARWSKAAAAIRDAYIDAYFTH